MTDDSKDREVSDPILPEANRYVRIFTDPIGRWLLSRFSGTRYYDMEESDRVEGAKKDFLNAFAHRSSRYAVIGIILLLVLMLIDCSHPGDFPKQMYGLTLDIVGATILGRGLLLSPEAIVEKATAGYGGPMPGFRAAQAEDVADGVWGIFLLILGVLLQGLAVTGFWIEWLPCSTYLFISLS